MATPPADARRDSQAPSLSPWLRQRVRHDLQSQRNDAKHTVDELLGRDVRAGLLPGRLALDKTDAAISGATQDALDAISQGLLVLAPTQRSSLVGVLSALLPRRRRYRISISPTARGSANEPRIGMSLEVAELDGPPIATTTFWNQILAMRTLTRFRSDARLDRAS